MLLLNFLNVLPPFKSWKVSSVDYYLLLEKRRCLGLVAKGQLVMRGS